jgi:hypothetical protein
MSLLKAALIETTMIIISDIPTVKREMLVSSSRKLIEAFGQELRHPMLGPNAGILSTPGMPISTKMT